MSAASGGCFDLNRLRLAAGDGRRLELTAALEPFSFGGQRYRVVPQPLPVVLELSRTAHGYALRLRFTAALDGPCMRCLGPAMARFEVDAREVWQPGAVEEPGSSVELDSPYLDGGVLDLGAWSRDALALSLPPAIVCREDCAGLCAVCGADLAGAGPGHGHAAEPDPRWAKLSEVRFE